MGFVSITAVFIVAGLVPGLHGQGSALILLHFVVANAELPPSDDGGAQWNGGLGFEDAKIVVLLCTYGFAKILNKINSGMTSVFFFADIASIAVDLAVGSSCIAGIAQLCVSGLLMVREHTYNQKTNK